MKGYQSDLVIVRSFTLIVDFDISFKTAVTSKIYMMLFLGIKMRSGLRELPVIREGDRNA